MKKVWPVALLALVGCSFFSDVQIPFQDDTAPTLVASIWQDGEYSFETNRTTHDLDEEFFALAAITDSGGAKRVTMSHGIVVNCVSDSGIGLRKVGDFAPLEATQAGEPGDTVKNGVWTGRVFKARDHASCGSSMTLTSVRYWWTLSGEDFHGNSAIQRQFPTGGQIVYTP